MARTLEQIIKRHRSGGTLTKADQWELKYEFEKAVLQAVKDNISRFGVGDMDPWQKLIKLATSELEDEAYARGIAEGKSNV